MSAVLQVLALAVLQGLTEFLPVSSSGHLALAQLLFGDSLAVEDALDTSLQPHKIQYVFEGVSHLVAAILISSAATIKKINSNGVKKMCRNIFAIQHTLTASITGRRELALDHAKNFYELFTLTPKELLSNIIEMGAVYRELDYMNALQLMHRYRQTISKYKVTG